MNTNMTGLDIFQKSLLPCALDECSRSIGRVNTFSDQKQPNNFGEIFQVEQVFGTYLKEKCLSQYY